jgi:hypothetical protein
LKIETSKDTVAAFVSTPAVGSSAASISFISISMSSNIAGSAVLIILHFVPLTSIVAGGSITLTLPSGYFLGMAQGLVFGVTVSATNVATASSFQIVLPISAFLPASTALVVTLSGLSLGAVQAGTPSGFKLSSSADPALSNGLDAPAIVAHVANVQPPSSQSDISVSNFQNALRLSFQTKHICSVENVTRSCLIRNSSFPSGSSFDPPLHSPPTYSLF